MSVRWLDGHKTVVYHRLEGKWTWAEFHKAHGDVIRLMNSVDNPVSLLMEFVDWASGVIPSGLFLQAQRILKGFPENHQKIIVVSQSPLIHIAVVGVKQVIRMDVAKAIQVVPSIDEAHGLLHASTNVLV